MMPATDFICCLHKRFFPLFKRKLIQHIGSGHRMPLHNSKFFSCQSARLVQNLIRNGNFTNIMKSRCRTDQPDLLFADSIRVLFFLYQMSQKHVCDHLNVQNMKPALAITKFYNMRENANHQLAALLSFVNLVRYNSCHSTLLRSQQNRIGRTSANHVSIKGLANKVCHSKIIASLNVSRRILCRNNNYRNIIDPVFLVHICKYFKAVHLRHNKIQKHQRKLFCVLMQIIYRLNTIISLHNIIFIFQNCSQKISIHLRIICNKNLLSSLCYHFTHVYIPLQVWFTPPTVLFSNFTAFHNSGYYQFPASSPHPTASDRYFQFNSLLY